jgi:ATP-dependent RNA helicase CshB
VTTDVASRGIDIDGISTVVHFHMPKDLDTFVHRTG